LVYLISYDLINPGQRYKEVHEEIKSLGAWAKPLESTWFVDTTLSANQISEKVWKHMDANDFLLVIAVKRDYQGYLKPEIWDWLSTRI
jgi:hypothetical protein